MPLDLAIRRQAESDVLTNRNRFLALARPLYLLAEQGLAVRGHRGESMAELRASVHARQAAQEKYVSDKLEDALNPSAASQQPVTAAHDCNPGNLLALVRFLAVHHYDKVLDHEIFAPDSQLRPRVTYHSPEIQDELIRIFAAIIRKSLLDEISMAPCFAILADEATDASNQQQLSLCVRFLDSKYTIREEFLGFFSPKSTSTGAEALTDAILATVRHLRLNMDKCCGQGYDGCSTMAGEHSGVAARVMRIYPFAHSFHCSAHVLSLCVSAACMNNSSSLVRNAMAQVDNVWLFFKYSPKRSECLKSCIDNITLPGQQATERKGQLKGFSPTC